MSARPTRLALALRLYLAVNEIDQKEIAKQWACSDSTVSKFLKGQVMPESLTVIKIFAWSLEQEE